MRREIFENAKIEVLEFSSEDIIATTTECPVETDRDPV